MKRNVAVITCLSLFVTSLAVGAGVTFAAYSSPKREVLNMAVTGAHGTTLFLNPAIWEVDGPEFRIYAWNDAGDDPLWIAPTYKNTTGYYVFEYDNYTYPNLIFARMSPEGATLANFTDSDPKNPYRWNKVEAGAVPSDGKNCFKVTAWKKSETSGIESYGEWETFANS